MSESLNFFVFPERTTDERRGRVNRFPPHRLFSTVLLQKTANTIVPFWKAGVWEMQPMPPWKGCNDKIQTMLRKAYGYRDFEYMYFKILNQPDNGVKIIF